MHPSQAVFFASCSSYKINLQNADIADALQLRDVDMATTFWLPIYGMHIGAGATWRIRPNRPCAAAMRPYVKNYFGHLLLLLASCNVSRTRAPSSPFATLSFRFKLWPVHTTNVHGPCTWVSKMTPVFTSRVGYTGDRHGQ